MSLRKVESKKSRREEEEEQMRRERVNILFDQKLKYILK